MLDLPREALWDWEKYNDGTLIPGNSQGFRWGNYKPQKKELVTIYKSTVDLDNHVLIVHPKFEGNNHDTYCPKDMKGHSWNVRIEQIDFNVKNKPCRMRTTHVRVVPLDISV